MGNTARGLVDQLARARVARRWSQTKTALRCGYSRPILCRWESGRDLPRLTSFVDWANALGFDVVLVRKGAESGDG